MLSILELLPEDASLEDIQPDRYEDSGQLLPAACGLQARYLPGLITLAIWIGHLSLLLAGLALFISISLRRSEHPVPRAAGAHEFIFGNHRLRWG